MPGALIVSVPCAEGVIDMPGVADILFNTDSVTIGVTDGLAEIEGVAVISAELLPEIVRVAVWLTVVEPLALRLGSIEVDGVTVPSGDGVTVTRGVTVALPRLDSVEL